MSEGQAYAPAPVIPVVSVVPYVFGRLDPMDLVNTYSAAMVVVDFDIFTSLEFDTAGGGTAPVSDMQDGVSTIYSAMVSPLIDEEFTVGSFRDVNGVTQALKLNVAALSGRAASSRRIVTNEPLRTEFSYGSGFRPQMREGVSTICRIGDGDYDVVSFTGTVEVKADEPNSQRWIGMGTFPFLSNEQRGLCGAKAATTYSDSRSCFYTSIPPASYSNGVTPFNASCFDMACVGFVFDAVAKNESPFGEVTLETGTISVRLPGLTVTSRFVPRRYQRVLIAKTADGEVNLANVGGASDPNGAASVGYEAPLVAWQGKNSGPDGNNWLTGLIKLGGVKSGSYTIVTNPDGSTSFTVSSSDATGGDDTTSSVGAVVDTVGKENSLANDVSNLPDPNAAPVATSIWPSLAVAAGATAAGLGVGFLLRRKTKVSRIGVQKYLSVPLDEARSWTEETYPWAIDVPWGTHRAVMDAVAGVKFGTIGSALKGLE